VHKLIPNLVICCLAGNFALAPIRADVHGGEAHTMPAGPDARRPPSDRPADVPAAGLDSAGPSSATADTNESPGGLQSLEELTALSAALVEKAGSGATPAHEFRLEARLYRELLRRAMLSNRERPENEQLPQPILLEMVRMSALLHSAADCKTGRVITCPVDLLLQLEAQQARITEGQKTIDTTVK
jgi:hypothetical protein